MEAGRRHRLQIENSLRNLFGKELADLVQINDAICNVFTRVLAPLEELFKVTLDR